MKLNILYMHMIRKYLYLDKVKYAKQCKYADMRKM